MSRSATSAYGLDGDIFWFPFEGVGKKPASPKVSVVVCSFNHGPFIKECLTSVFLNATLCGDFDIEVVVVDDCSEDDSVRVAKETLGELDLSAVLVAKHTNRGLKHSIGLGLEHATGKYIQILSSDDVLLEHKFRSQLEYLEENHETAAVYGGCLVLKTNGEREFQEYESFNRAVSGDATKLHKAVCELEIPLPMGQGALFRAGPLEAAFQKTRELLNDDWSLMIELSRSSNIAYIDRPMVVYRIHDGGMHHNRPLMLINQLEVIALLIDKQYQRKALASVLRIHSLTYWTERKRVAALYFMFLSIVTTGVFRPWLPFVGKALTGALRLSASARA